eukprot:scaffold24992_cov63-Phaeocystis_antarctica.AAC.2
MQFKVLSTVLSGVVPKFLAPRLICFLPADGIGKASDQNWLAKITSRPSLATCSTRPCVSSSSTRSV